MKKTIITTKRSSGAQFKRMLVKDPSLSESNLNVTPFSSSVFISWSLAGPVVLKLIAASSLTPTYCPLISSPLNSSSFISPLSKLARNSL